MEVKSPVMRHNKASKVGSADVWTDLKKSQIKSLQIERRAQQHRDLKSYS